VTHLYATLHTLGVTLRDGLPPRAVRTVSAAPAPWRSCSGPSPCWPWPASSTPPSTPTSRASCPASPEHAPSTPPRGRTPTPPRVRGRAARRGVASIQIVVLMPVLFLLMFIGMQAAIIYHGRTVAIAAAQEGARAAAAQNGTTAGQSAATAFVAGRRR
jgi:hypothetical protein